MFTRHLQCYYEYRKHNIINGIQNHINVDYVGMPCTEMLWFKGEGDIINEVTWQQQVSISC